MRVPQSAVGFDSREFEFVHGRKPSGVGVWFFEAAGVQFFKHGAFSAVKAEARAFFAARGVRQVKVAS